MKFAFCLFKYFPYGGLQRDFLRIAEQCLQRGHSVHVYTMAWEGEIPENLQVTLLPVRGIWNHRRCLAFSKQLSAVLATEHYDLVIGFNKMPGLDVYYAADPCYAAKVQTRPFYRMTGRYRTYIQLEKSVFAPETATKILLLAEREQTQFSRSYQTPAQRFQLLAPGINRDFSPPPHVESIRATTRLQLNIPADQHFILMIGSGFKTKGVDRALRALAALPNKLQTTTHLIIVGQGNPKPYLKLAKQLGISDRVQFLGGRDDVAPFLWSADLLLHPAYTENTGGVLLEALVAGLPVLTTDICGYAKHIRSAHAGTVLPLPFQQNKLNQELANCLNTTVHTIWQRNALNYAAKTDLYSLVEQAVTFIENHTSRDQTKKKSRANNIDSKNILSLNPALQMHFKHNDIFTAVFAQQGEFFRQHKNRQTLRFIVDDQPYFVKRHNGVGWREIFKNLLHGRLPVLGAKQEWQAIQRLTQLNIHTTPLVGYGSRGLNPAQRQSFVITEALTDTISLEDFCRDWATQPPANKLKHALIAAVAHIARTLHNNGINHRDFYLCHFLLDMSASSENISPQSLKLYLIDLHRTQLRTRAPKRWVIKDLAGLYFSSMDMGLTDRDLLRFIKSYNPTPLREYLTNNRRFLQSIKRRALRLYAKTQQQTLAAHKTLASFSPFRLAITDSQQLLHCKQLLRVIPNKRWVLLAEWDSQIVIAKLFKKAHHAARELQGHHALVTANITTPKLLFHGWSRGAGFYMLIYERIHPAQDFATLWAQTNSTQHDSLLTKLLTTIAGLHANGLVQHDLHFKNFLLQQQQIYTLDAADIYKIPRSHPLAENKYRKNLALLFAQLPSHYDLHLEKFYRFYLQQRGSFFTLTKLAKLKKWLNYWRRHRLLAYGRKIFRTSTALLCQKTWRQFLVCDRAYNTKAMQLFLQNPEAIMQGPAAKILKAGNTCTVVCITIGGRKLVVKRYNIKNFWHGVNRALRRSRAATSWRNAHRLMLSDIPTAKPVALLENRWGPLRRTSYFISEYVPGANLADHLTQLNSLEEQLFISAEITRLFNRLADLQISHGDLKATNILMAGTWPILVDLDAMRLHQYPWTWRSAKQRDQARFMRNWQDQPELAKLFEIGI